MFDANIPPQYWVDTMLTAVHLINLLSSPTTKSKSPHQLLFQHKPNYSHLRIYGCACYPLIPSQNRTKLQPCSTQCLFLGYATNSKGYKCLDLSTGRLIISRHTVFDESTFPLQQNPSPSATPASSTQDTPLPPLLLTPLQPIPASTSTTIPLNSPVITTPVADQTQSLSTSASPLLTPTTSPPPTEPPPPQNQHPMVTRMKTGSLQPKSILNLTTNIIPTDPTSYSQASKYPPWRQAMTTEYQALQAQHTWILVPPSTNQPILGSRWTFRTKYHPDGSIARYKARLVAQGHTQEFGINYTDTFSPVAKIPTIRVLLTVAAHYRWPVQQLDVSNAFLHGDLSDTVYMHQPPGYKDATFPHHVCLLKKAIYGLKQSPRQWFHAFSGHLLKLGFQFSIADTSLMYYRTTQIQIFILIYVDDILLTGNSPSAISALIAKLQQSVNLKLLGPINHFLGLKVLTTPTGFLLTQSHYAATILHKAGLANCKPIPNPLPSKVPTAPTSEQQLQQPQLFRHLVGALQYLTITRPDIQFTVNNLCQHLHTPTEGHFQLLKRLLRYIQGTKDLAFPIHQTDLTLHSFADANWASDISDRRSISGHCSYLDNTLISWQVKKQPTVSKSSTEAEYRALALAAMDILWLRRLLKDFNIPCTSPTDLRCDNLSAIALANNLVFHARTKHIEIDYHFIRERVQSGEIQVIPVRSQDQYADIFTKSLPTPHFLLLRHKLTLQPCTVHLRGGDNQHTQQETANQNHDPNGLSDVADTTTYP